MLQEVFKRYEKKYLLTEDGFRRLMLAVGGSFQPDQYEQYQILSLIHIFFTRDSVYGH